MAKTMVRMNNGPQEGREYTVETHDVTAMEAFGYKACVISDVDLDKPLKRCIGKTVIDGVKYDICEYFDHIERPDFEKDFDSIMSIALENTKKKLGIE